MKLPSPGVSYLLCGLFLAALAVFMLWPPPSGYRSLPIYTLPESELAEPVTAGADENIVCVFQPMSGTLVSAAEVTTEIGNGAALLAFKVPKSTIKRQQYGIKSAECVTSQLDRDFANGKFRTAGTSNGIRLFTNKIGLSTGENIAIPFIYVSSLYVKETVVDIDIEDFRSECSNMVFEKHGLAISKDEQCTRRPFKLKASNLSNADKQQRVFITCRNLAPKQANCTLGMKYSRLSVYISFDYTDLEHWQDIKETAIQ